MQDIPPGLPIEHRPVVLKHGGLDPLPVSPAGRAARYPTRVWRPEVQRLQDKRSAFFRRLRTLRAAGLPALESQSLLRTRTSGDFVFLARCCGIPASDAAMLDEELAVEAARLVGLQDDEMLGTTRQRLFLAGRHGGDGFQSVALASPAAYAASWQWCLPVILRRLRLPSTSSLAAVSPWACRVLPVVEAIVCRCPRHATHVGFGPDCCGTYSSPCTALIGQARGRSLAQRRRYMGHSHG